MASVAINPETREIRVLTPSGEWEPARRARNPQTGAELYFDGAAWQPVPEPPTTLGGVASAAGRGLLRGVGSLPALAADVLKTVVAPPLQAEWNPTVSDALNRSVDYVLPRAPGNATERTVETVASNVGAAVPTMLFPAGRALAGSVPTQLSAATGAGLASSAAREAGAGPLGEFGASLAGGVAGAAVPAVAGVAGRAVAGAAAPFTRAGREAIVTDTMLRASSDPARAGARTAAGLADDTRRLPGSTPTTAQAARDPGLAILEQGARQDAEMGGAFRAADAARNASRSGFLASQADNIPPEVRGATVRGAVQANERATLDAVSTVYQAIDPTGTAQFPTRQLQSAAGAAIGRFGQGSGGAPAELLAIADDLRAAGNAVSWEFLQNLRARVGEVSGIAASQGQNRLAGAMRLIGQAIDAAEDAGVQSGRFAPWQRDLWRVARETRRQAGETFNRNAEGVAVVGAMLRTDRFGNPMIADAEVARRVLSSPQALRQVLTASGAARPVVERTLAGQFIEDLTRAGTVTSAFTDAGGNITRAISPAQVTRFLDANRETVNLLFPGARGTMLRRLAADMLETTAADASRGTRGSQTAMNLSVAALINRASNGLIDPTSPTAQAIVGLGPVLRWIYSAPERATRDLLAQAMVDPRFGSALLSRATPEAIRRATGYIERNFAERMRQAATDAAGRAAVRAGTATGAQATREEPRQP